MTAPDPSSGQEQPRICPRCDSMQNDFFLSGQERNVLTIRKKVIKGHAKMITFRQNNQKGTFGVKRLKKVKTNKICQLYNNMVCLVAKSFWSI